jgi:nitroimidazol reductase NimA-like FMN-containing flavoprotein (pyridoxamine 5'-phosphate oxidase superfamily)
VYREMRRREKKMGVAEAKAFLEAAKVGRLALSVNDEPYVVPVIFVYFNATIFFHCAREGKKIDYISANARVCFEVDEFLEVKTADPPCNSTLTYRSVIAYGAAAFVDDVGEREAVLMRLMEKYGRTSHVPFDTKMLEQTVIVAINVDWLTGKQSV